MKEKLNKWFTNPSHIYALVSIFTLIYGFVVKKDIFPSTNHKIGAIIIILIGITMTLLGLCVSKNLRKWITRSFSVCFCLSLVILLCSIFFIQKIEYDITLYLFYIIIVSSLCYITLQYLNKKIGNSKEKINQNLSNTYFQFDNIKTQEQFNALKYLVEVGKVQGLWTNNNGKRDQIEKYLLKSVEIKIKVTRGDDLFEVVHADDNSPRAINPILLNAINNPKRVKSTPLRIKILIMTPCFKSTHLQNRWQTKNGTYTEEEFFSSAYRVAAAIERLNNDATKNVDIEYRFYGDLDAKWRYYICELPVGEPNCLFLSAYMGSIEGDDLDSYQIFYDGNRQPYNLYSYMDMYFDEIWDRALTIDDLKNNIANCEGICFQNKCKPLQRSKCMQLSSNVNSQKFPCYIAEISGKDSIAAVLSFINEKISNQECVKIVPTIGLTGTEYSVNNNLDIYELYQKSLDSLRKFVANDGREEYIYLAETHYLKQYELWNRLNAKYINKLINKFNVALPCITCHLYLHLLRVPLYINMDAKAIITGERHYHGNKIKTNQHPHTINCYEKIFKNDSCPINFERPLLRIQNDEDIESLLKEYGIKYDSKDVSCVFRENTHGLSFNGKKSKYVKNLTNYLDEFVKPIGSYLLKVLSEQRDINLSPQLLQDLDKEIERILK